MLGKKIMREREGITRVQAIVTAVIIIVAIAGGTYWYITQMAKPPVPPKPKEVNIGVIVPLSGPAAKVGEGLVEGIKAYAEEVDYTVAGMKINLIIRDTELDPKTALAAVMELDTKYDVSAIIGPVGSEVAMGIKPYIEENHIPLLITMVSDNEYPAPGTKYAFRMHHNQWIQGQGYAEYIASVMPGAKRFFWTGPDLKFVHIIRECFGYHIKKYGGEVVGEEYYSPRLTDFTSIIMKIKAKDPDALIVIDPYGSYVTYYGQMIDLGFPKEKIISFMNDYWMAEALGDKILGSIGIQTWTTDFTTNPISIEWETEFIKKYDKLPSVYDAIGYTDMQIIAIAIEESGSIDREMIRDTISKTRFSTIMGPVKYNEWGQDDPTVFFVKWIKDPKYGYRMIPVWEREIPAGIPPS